MAQTHTLLLVNGFQQPRTTYSIYRCRKHWLRVALDIQSASNPVTIATDGGAISRGEWHHVAVTWDGSTYRAFLDGTLEGSTSNSNAPVASSQVVRVGYNTNAHYFGGYISNVRWVTNGGAIYTSNFTPQRVHLQQLAVQRCC